MGGPPPAELLVQGADSGENPNARFGCEPRERGCSSGALPGACGPGLCADLLGVALLHLRVTVVARARK